MDVTKKEKCVLLANLVRGYFRWFIFITWFWACRKSCSPSHSSASLECATVLSSIICWWHESKYRRLTSSLIYGFHCFCEVFVSAIEPLRCCIVDSTQNNCTFLQLVSIKVPPLSEHHASSSRDVVIGGVGLHRPFLDPNNLLRQLDQHALF